MRISLLSALSIPALSLALVAQVSPGIAITKTNDLSNVPSAPEFAATKLGAATGGQVGQLELTDLGNGTFRIAATVTSLTVANGGKGSWDGVECLFTPPSTVQVFNYASAMNTTGAEFALSIARNGLFAVIDQPSGCKWSKRAATGTAWGAVAAITGLPAGAGPYCDSKIYYDDFGQGQVLCFAFIDGNGNISGGQINTTNGAMSNIGQVILADPSGTTAHSPNPIYGDGVAGNVMAWINSNQIASDSDNYFQADRNDMINGPQRIRDQADWLANPGQYGSSGTTYWCLATTAYVDPENYSLVATNGQRFPAAQNTTLNYRVWIPQDAMNPWIAGWAIGVAAAPLPLPGSIGNALAQTAAGPRPPGDVGLFPAVVLSAPVAPGAGGATFSFPLAANTVGAGIPVTTQGFALNVISNELVMGNTAITQGY